MNNYFLKFGLLLFLATGSTLIYFFTTDSSQNISQLKNGQREYILKNTEIYGSNNEGIFSYKIFSKKAKTSDLKQTIYLEQLLIKYISEPEIDWEIQSDSGQVISQTNVLALSGNVVI